MALGKILCTVLMGLAFESSQRLAKCELLCFVLLDLFRYYRNRVSE